MKPYLKQLISTALFFVLSMTLSAQTVYLAEASRNPFVRTMFIDTKGETFRYTAFYKSASAPQSDIAVSFFVDAAKATAYNAQYGTTYKMLPKGSYTVGMNSAVIVQGSVSAAPGEVKVTGKGYLKDSEKYILPITVKVEGKLAEVDPALSTIYYIITAVPAPGNVVRKKIGQLPSETKSVFGFGDKYLMVDGGNGKLTQYLYSGSSLGKATTVEGTENLEGQDIIMNFRDHHLVGLIREVNGGELWSFPISSDGRVSPRNKVFGHPGYSIFSDIFPLGNNLYCLYPTGELTIYPLSDAIEWTSPGVRSLGSGWNYPVMFGYGNSILCIDTNGDIWKYALNAAGMPGIPSRIGSGWNGYAKIAVLGADLIALDKDGALWQIKFDDKKFWAF